MKLFHEPWSSPVDNSPVTTPAAGRPLHISSWQLGEGCGGARDGSGWLGMARDGSGHSVGMARDGSLGMARDRSGSLGIARDRSGSLEIARGWPGSVGQLGTARDRRARRVLVADIEREGGVISSMVHTYIHSEATDIVLLCGADTPAKGRTHRTVAPSCAPAGQPCAPRSS